MTIKKRKDFQFASASGAKFITNSIILQMVKRSEKHHVPPSLIRIGFTVTKKMGGAVVRNRIKRRLREVSKPILEQYGKSGCDYVVISRHKVLTSNFSELKRDMEFAFARIIHHKSNNLKSSSQIH